ncbi:MAG TPA: phospholipase D-like domain-containing protein [Solirubrobacteraceae bacterium]|nr:phospholipase D-like domain-containing protein [Solirubrobacteraceae bacterium]
MPAPVLSPALDVRTLVDGGQRANDIADWLEPWLSAARRSLDLALYDVRLPGEVGDRVAGAIRSAQARGAQVRIAYNLDEPDDEPRPFEPPPPRTEPSLLAQLGVPLKGIPGWRDLMHHKYAVRDGAAVWTGSANWTLDSWEREENAIATVESGELAAAYTRNFEQLWRHERVEDSGNFDLAPVRTGDATVRPWFSPGRGPELSHRIAKRIGAARRRVRIASPVLTAGPILGTLGEVLSEGRVDVAGVCDATQVRQVFRQWDANPRSRWKAPLLQRALTVFHGKRSTPYAPGSVHDFMHAKVTVADDTIFVGSFNLSRSGEMNAENMLEIADPALAERMAAFVDQLRELYPPIGA